MKCLDPSLWLCQNSFSLNLLLIRLSLSFKLKTELQENNIKKFVLTIKHTYLLQEEQET